MILLRIITFSRPIIHAKLTGNGIGQSDKAPIDYRASSQVLGSYLVLKVSLNHETR